MKSVTVSIKLEKTVNLHSKSILWWIFFRLQRKKEDRAKYHFSYGTDEVYIMKIWHNSHRVIQNHANFWKHLVSHETVEQTFCLTYLSKMFLPYRYQSIYLHYKSNDWFLCEGTLVINDCNGEGNFIYLRSEKQPWENSFQSQQ